MPRSFQCLLTPVMRISDGKCELTNSIKLSGTTHFNEATFPIALDLVNINIERGYLTKPTE